MSRNLLLFSVLSVMLPVVRAQMTVSVSVPPDNNSTLLVSGSTIVFPPTAINAVTQATLTFTNTGPMDASVNGITLGGQNRTDFGLVNSPLFPVILQKGQSQAVGLKFSPHQATDSSAIMSIALNTPLLTISLVGHVANPQYALTYTDPDTSNVNPLTDGAQVTFPPVQAGTMLDVTFSARNTGIGPGTLDSISVTGSDFVTISRPLLPAVIAPSGAVNFGVRFRPTSTSPNPASATLVAVLGGTAFNISLSASVFTPPRPTPSFVYTISSPDGPAPISAGTNISLADTDVGSQSQMNLVVSNAGDGNGTIDSVGVQGAAFALDNGPPLPIGLAPGQSQKLTITFNPRSPDKFSGTLTIGNDSFPLTGTGLGGRLQLAYLAGATRVIIPENGTVPFPTVSLGSTTQMDVEVTNTGTTSVVITGVVPNSQNTTYRVPPLPVPATLAPQENIDFPVIFAPGAVGQSTGTLSVNTTSWNLSGLATAPPDLPGFHIDTNSTNVPPLTQPVLRLSLDNAYPMALSGTLSLAMVAAPYGIDPAVQWSTGGQTVAFSIPAGTTSAVFPGSKTDIGLQVGTLAGSIGITPAFSLDSGYRLKTSSADLTLTVPAMPPQLLNAQLQGATSTNFSVTVVGYSTTKQLSKLTFKFIPMPGAQLATNQVQLDVSANALVYYRSPLSQAFGGLFSITVPVALSTDQTTTTNLLAKIQDISVVASSDQGDSPPLTIALNTP